MKKNSLDTSKRIKKKTDDFYIVTTFDFDGLSYIK